MKTYITTENKHLTKNFFVLAIIILISSLLNAQNWKPVNSVNKYNYFIGDKPEATIWVDSVDILNGDSVYILNKVLKKVKDIDSYSCIASYLENQPQQFLSKITFCQNGEYKMENDTLSSFLLKPNNSLNKLWVFDSINNITATITSINSITIFNNTDSVKTIKLSNQDTIIISKNYGILKFPMFNSTHKHIYLAGIEGSNLGVIFPKFNDFFDFEIGDVFYYKFEYHQRFFQVLAYKKKTILSKEIKGDTIIYNINYKYHGTLHDNYDQYPDSVTYFDRNDTMIYINDTNNFLNKYNNQIVGGNDDYTKYKPVITNYEPSYNTYSKIYPLNSFCKSQYSDTIIECPDPSSCSFKQITYSYVKGYGMTNMTKLELNDWYEYDRTSEVLFGGIKNGQEYGESIALSIFPLQRNQIIFNLYPIPTKDFLSIESQIINDEYSIIIYDLTGKEVFSSKSFGNSKINITNLRGGIYFITLHNDKFVETHKIIKY